MSQETDLQKARSKSLVAHFKKGAAFHEKKADHHEKCMKAHEAAAEHHSSMMGKAADPADAHHKVKAAFHKTMASHHEKAHKLHKAHAEHHAAMADAHAEDAGAQKAAFAKLEIEYVEKAVAADPAPVVPVADPAPVISAGAADPAPIADPATKTVSTGDTMTDAEKLVAAAATKVGTVMNADPDNPLQKQLAEGLNEALRNGLKEILASPEFRKTVQEQLGAVLINELGKQTLAPTSIKTFAVNRPGIDPAKTATIMSGGTPRIDSTGVDPQFANLVSMES